MLEGKSVGVVIPAYNEELLLPDTLAGIPSFVDRVFVVDDASTDATVGRAHAAAATDPRIVVMVQERNRGAGSAVVRGYARAVEEEIDVVCVMNGDNQMDPTELMRACSAGCARGDRLYEGEPPLHRRSVESHSAHALSRKRGALAVHEDRLRVLACGGLASRIHGDRAADVEESQPPRDLSELRVPERHVGASEHLERACS